MSPDDFDPEEAHYPELMKKRMATATSHYTVQGIEPETLAYAMHDSPAGMAAWLIERRRLWSDSADESGHRDVERAFTMEELATLVSIYWFSGSFSSSLRMYYGRTNEPWEPAHHRTPVMAAPTAMAVFPGDLIFLPRRAAQRVANIQRWTRMPAGGHFAAAEEPDLVADDVAAFFDQFR
jgi:pimeloyl-ACP methyl ester carboxylesterase